MSICFIYGDFRKSIFYWITYFCFFAAKYDLNADKVWETVTVIVDKGFDSIALLNLYVQRSHPPQKGLPYQLGKIMCCVLLGCLGSPLSCISVSGQDLKCKSKKSISQRIGPFDLLLYLCFDQFSWKKCLLKSIKTRQINKCRALTSYGLLLVLLALCITRRGWSKVSKSKDVKVIIQFT